MARYILIGLIGALASVIVIMPAQWGARLLSKSAKAHIIPGSISGTLWQGRAAILPPKTSWPLHIDYKLNPLKALLRRPYTDTALSGRGFVASGQIGVFSRSHIAVKDLTADFNLPQLPISDPRFASFSGQAALTLDAVTINTTCERASGQLRTNILSANRAAFEWAGPILSGPISCDGDALLAALRGRDEAYDVALDIRLHPGGVYGLDMRIDPIGDVPEGFALALGLLGFESAPNGSAQLKERGQIFQGERP